MEIPDDRWPVCELQHPNRAEPGRSVSFAAGIIQNLDKFDAAFFGISPREAVWLDPQQRLLLEMTHESVEDAGLPVSTLAGSRCGVYMGISSLDYGLYGLQDISSMSAYSMTGNTLSVAANRLSYFFDLRGPSMAVDTACSSSLVALHHACAALHTGEIPLALAGGVNVLMHPYSFVGFSKASMLSGKGRCRPFDAAGDGYVRAEGGAVLLLKTLQTALHDGDRIHAVILASGVNADGGRKSGLTIPSVEAQAELMSNVLAKSGLQAEDVDFIEAHGTGTPVGDPVEATAIGQIYGHARTNPMPVSSVKANLGHLEPASGMAGLIKAMLALKKGVLPPMNLDFTPNTHIDFAGLNVHCAASGTNLEQDGRSLFTAGVNSFGFGGVNAHVILQGPPLPQVCRCPVVPVAPVASAAPVEMPPLLLSAKTEAALRELAEAYARCIEDAGPGAYYDVAYAAAFRRDRWERRLALAEESPAAVVAELRTFGQQGSSPHALLENAIAGSENGVVFVYSGNGAQWCGMGRALLAESPRFASIMDSLDAELRPLVNFSLQDMLLHATVEALQDTTVSQPLLFAVQVGVTLLLRERGITPQAVMGHSVGEIAAAWACGALTLAQAVRVIHARSHAQGLTRGTGRMAAVSMPAERAQELLSRMGMDGAVEIAGINSPHNVTLSGDASSLMRMQEYAQQQNIFFRMLDLDYAFHSRHMDGVRHALAEKLEGLTPAKNGDALFVSTVTGGTLEGTSLDREYWWNNVRKPVRFSEALHELANFGFHIFVEMGPHAILQRYIRESASSVAGSVAGSATSIRTLSALLRGDDGLRRIERLAARLHTLSDKENLRALFPHEGNRITLPHYPWQREHYWHPTTNESLPEKRRVHPLLGWVLDGADLAWENILHPTVLPLLADHRVGGAVVFPGAAYAEMGLAAAQAWLGDAHVALESLDITLPLVFDEGHSHCVRCGLNTADGAFRILSRPRLSNEDWVQHAAGRIVATAGRVTALNMEALPDSCTDMEGADLYALTEALGLQYGPTFRRVRRVRMEGNRLDVELVPGDEGTHDYLLHPAALDACFHSLVSLYTAWEESAPRAFLPVKTGRLERCGEGAVSHIRGRLRSCGSRSLAADFVLLDGAGTVTAIAHDCRFRAVPLACGNKEAVSSWSILPWSCPRPLRNAPVNTPSPEDMADHLAQCFPACHDESRRQWFRHTLPLLEALTLSCALHAFRTWGKGAPLQESGLSSPHAQWLSRLLREEGLLHTDKGQWNLRGGDDIPPPEELWREILQQAPQCLSTLLAVGRVGHRLTDILQGREDATAVLEAVRNAAVFKGGEYASVACQGVDAALQAALRRLARDWPTDRRLRVIEISAASGELTDVLDAQLPADGFEHVLALWDAEAVGQARSRYRAHPAVEVVPFDVARWNFEETGISGRCFDVVILNHALHRTADLDGALDRVRAMLAGRGLLLVAERHPDWHINFVEGLNPGWWRQTGDASQPLLSSLLSPEVWLRIFEDHGLCRGRVYTEPAAEDLAEGTYLLLASHAACEPEPAEKPAPASWLMLADASSRSLAEALCDALRAQGQQTLCLYGEEEDQRPKADHVVFMRGMEDAPNMADTAIATVDELRRCAEMCAGQDVSPRLWIITRGGALGAQLPDGYALNPAQCALWGFGRVIANEYPELRCVLLDVPVQAAPVEALASRLQGELLCPDGNDEILLDSSARHALRLEKDSLRKNTFHAATERCRLDFTVPGRLHNLVWHGLEALPPGPGEVEARVMSTGLNFRDVMLTMGLVPDDALENGFAGANLGLEFSGIVTRIGEGVEGLKVGDSIMGFAPSCFSSHVRTPARTVAPMPASWSFSAAATVPTVFLTAYYALKHLAQAQPDERVLIHGAAGGVGLAAIQVARYLGVEIFATAGSEEKRDFLRLLGVEHVFDSRSMSFAHDVLAATGGQGVDMVLNSLTGEAMRRSLGVLRPFGRFLELGKRDFIENTSLGLRPFKENISYFAIDADQLIVARPKLASALFAEVMQLLHEGVFSPLPHRVFPAAQAVDAFRTMQQARHIGKIVVSLAELPRLPSPPDSVEKTVLDGNATWIVTGGLNGFGLASAQELARLGVKNLVLVGRRGAQSPDAARIVAEFADKGVQARAEACDVADSAAVHALVARITESMPPLKGVVHAAAVFDDRMLAQLDAASLKAVLDPKLSGAWHLHQATLHAPLEHFVLYSSISTALGNPGQGNYVAANAGMEGLAHLRARMGLPATCLAWGPVGDVGYLTRHEAVKKSLAQRLGREPLSSTQAMNEFAAALGRDTNGGAKGAGTRILANVDWDATMGMFAEGGAMRFAHVLRHADKQRQREDARDMQQILADKTPTEVNEIVSSLIASEVAQVLGLGEEQVPSDRALQSMGMDSLMAVELAVGLEQRVGVRLPAMMLQDSPTVEQIAARIVARLGGAGQREEDQDMAATLARQHAEELSAEDREAMMRSAGAQQEEVA